MINTGFSETESFFPQITLISADHILTICDNLRDQREKI
jgi:hypothetical protein